jgi:hypothetical protein
MKLKLSQGHIQKLIEMNLIDQNEIIREYFEYDVPKSVLDKMMRTITPKEEKPALKRGRPRKDQSVNLVVGEPETNVDIVTSNDTRPKRGRPRKNPLTQPVIDTPDVEMGDVNVKKSGFKGRPVNPQKVFDKIKYYVERGIFNKDQLYFLGNLILDKLSELDN